MACDILRKNQVRQAKDNLEVVDALDKNAELDLIAYTPPKASGEYSDPITMRINDLNDILSDAIHSGILESFDSKSPAIFKAIDEYAEEHLGDSYKRLKATVLDTWWNSSIVQRMREYVSPDGVVKSQLADLRAVYHNASQVRVRTMNHDAKIIDDMIATTNYNDSKKKILTDIFGRSAIFSSLTEVDRIASGQSTIDEEIAKYIKDSGLKDRQIQKADKYSALFIDGVLTENMDPNLSLSQGADTANKILKLASLYSLKRIKGSTDILRDLSSNHPQLFKKLKTETFVLKSLNTQMHKRTGDVDISLPNLVEDIFHKPMEFYIVTPSMLKKPEYSEKQGWTVVRQPDSKKKQYGIIAREKTSGLTEGIAVNTGYINNGIHISQEAQEATDYFLNTPHINSIDVTGKAASARLVLTAEEKQKINIENSPAKMLVRAYAHKEFILATQSVRETLSKSFTGKYYKPSDLGELDNLIEKGHHPIFLKLPEGMTLDDVSPEIRREYEPVDKNIISDIAGFSKGFDYVRTRMSDSVIGYKDITMFSNNRTMQQASEIVKQLVVSMKIHDIIVNPSKVAMDFTSGITLALSKGASVKEVIDYGKEAIIYSKEMSKLRNDLHKAIYRQRRGANNQSEIDKLSKQITEHPFSAALSKGFLQSISTDMVLKDMDSVSGLQNNINDLFDKITKNKDGTESRFAQAVFKVADFLPVEDVFRYFANAGKDLDPTEFSTMLENATEDIKKIKNQRDATAMLSELVAAPDSILVRAGSAATLYADLIPRWITYRHNINDGATAQNAADDALDTYIDYKINMPRELKWASDYFLIPYPSFFLRIQRVIVSMAVNNPIGFGAGIMSNQFIGEHGQNIIQSNIFNRLSNGTLVSAPEPTWSMFLPDHLL